jgi:hypothetical protein
MKVKKTTKVQIGARRLGPKKVETLSGREENRKHKSNFKAGAFAATDPNAGRKNGRLIPEHENATPVPGEARS